MSHRPDPGGSISSRPFTSRSAVSGRSRRSSSRSVPLTAAQAALLARAQERGLPTDFRAPVGGGTANALRALTRRGLIDQTGGITPDGADALMRHRLRADLTPGP